MKTETPDTGDPINQLHQLLFHNHTAVMLIIDPINGRIVDANQSAADFYGWTQEQLRKMNIKQINTLSEQEVLSELESARTLKRDHFEFRHRLADGSVRDVEVWSGKIILNDKEYLHSIVQDVTLRKQSEAALRESESKYRLLIDSVLEGIWVIDKNSITTFVNPHMAKMLGYTVEEMQGKHFFSFMDERGIEIAARLLERRTQGVNEEHDVEFLRKDGARIYASINATALTDESGTYSGALAAVMDVTERKKSENSLRESEEKLRALFDNSKDAIGISKDGIAVMVNNAYLEMFGYTYQNEISGKPILNQFAPKEHDRIKSYIAKRNKGEDVPRCYEALGIRKDGTEFPLELNVGTFVLHGETYSIGIIRDITERKITEKTLKDNEEKFRRIVESSPIAKYFYHLESDDRLILVGANPSADRIIGIEHKNLIGKTIEEAFPQLALTDIPSMYRKVAKGLINNQSFEIAYNDDRFSGYYNVTVFKVDENHIVVDFVDVSERKQADKLLQESRNRLELALTSAQLGIWDWDIVNNKMVWDDQMFRLYGIAEKPSSYGVEIWKCGLHPDDIAYVWETCQAAIKGEKKYDIEFRVKHPTGAVRIIKADGIVLRDDSGKAVRMLGINRDITDQRALEEERLKYEQQLQQNQKLESLGVLAGGIAHDFNNLLGGIYGYIDLAGEITTNTKLSQHLSKAMNTIERARNLTLQLITFAKGGAPVKSVGQLFPFIRETAQFALSGTNIKPKFDIQSDLWLCEFDKNQIGQVVDNIVINAKQAMPNGGTIEISANNISIKTAQHPFLGQGRYVKISIKDTGTGIPEEILPRIFDPFFTTKNTGHGLGLATCYSIIKRHGGAIDVESEQGKGSIFHLILPATDKELTSIREKVDDKFRGAGTFVVMDDEEVMRDVTASMLEAFGYSVICKANGRDAIEFITQELSAGRKIAGGIFDLTVPGEMGGEQAMQALVKSGFQAPIFASSGHAEDPIIARPEEFGFAGSISKPFRKAELLQLLQKHLKNYAE